MKRLLLIISLIATISFKMSAQYQVYDFSGKVTLEKGGKSLPVSKKMDLTGADVINIPQGGFMELLNTRSSQIFRSTTTGRMAVTQLMIKAEKQATDNAQSIHDNMKNVTGVRKKQTVIRETGMVTRSLTALDPAVAAMGITQENICECLLNAIRNNNYTPRTMMPVSITGGSNDNGGIKFSMTSEYGYPVYFNVLKIKPDGFQVEVSELGQPIGNYMLATNQSISREQFSGLEEGCRHIVLMTPVPFNLNGLLKDIEEMMSNTTTTPVPAVTKDLPVYIHALD